MASLTHTYGQDCTLQPASNPFTRRASEISDEAPAIRAHFFYSSNLPIDDPLSPIPPPASGSTAGPSKVPPQPFSVYDNIALEEAWQALQKGLLEKDGSKNTGAQALDEDQHVIRRVLSSFGGPDPSPAAVDNLAKVIRSAHQRRSFMLDRQRSGSVGPKDEGGKTVVFSADVAATSKPSTQKDVEAKPHTVGDPHLTLCDNPDHIPFDHAMPVGTDEIGNEEFESGMSRKRRRSPFRKLDKASQGSLHQKKKSKETIYGASPSERDTTGTPFLRVSERLKRARSRSSGRMRTTNQTDGADSLDEDGEVDTFSSRPLEKTFTRDRSDSTMLPRQGQRGRASTAEAKPNAVLVPVGISRLHMVEMPDLKVIMTCCHR